MRGGILQIVLGHPCDHGFGRSNWSLEVRCPWSGRRREKRIAELRTVATNRPDREVVLFADEVDVHKNARIGPDGRCAGLSATSRLSMNNENWTTSNAEKWTTPLGAGGGAVVG